MEPEDVEADAALATSAAERLEADSASINKGARSRRSPSWGSAMPDGRDARHETRAARRVDTGPNETRSHIHRKSARGGEKHISAAASTISCAGRLDRSVVWPRHHRCYPASSQITSRNQVGTREHRCRDRTPDLSSLPAQRLLLAWPLKPARRTPPL